MSSLSLRRKVLSVFFFSLIHVSAQEGWIFAPNIAAEPINQLKSSGNACGPACLLNAAQAGNQKWQTSFAAITGKDDRSKIIAMVNKYGRIGSTRFPTRPRYNLRDGVNVADLTDMANDMRVNQWQSRLDYRLLFRDERSNSVQLLAETHKLFRKSLTKGFPPIIHLQRVVLREVKGGNQMVWTTVKSHFVVVTGLPDKLQRGATTFPITYLDPWGGRRLQGQISIPAQANSPKLVTNFPESKVGLSLAGKNEVSALTLASVIGDF